MQCHDKKFSVKILTQVAIQGVVILTRPVEPSVTGIKMVKKLFTAKSSDQGVLQNSRSSSLE